MCAIHLKLTDFGMICCGSLCCISFPFSLPMRRSLGVKGAFLTRVSNASSGRFDLRVFVGMFD